jgi:hypothetical protein
VRRFVSTIGKLMKYKHSCCLEKSDGSRAALIQVVGGRLKHTTPSFYQSVSKKWGFAKRQTTQPPRGPSDPTHKIALATGVYRTRWSWCSAVDEMNANERSASLPTALPRPFLFGHGTIRDDVAWGFLAGRSGHRHLFAPQTG